MNRQISQVGVAELVLLAALIIGTTYWQMWANADLAAKQDNAIQTVAQFTIKRGRIYAADGRTLLATNVKRQVDGQTFYFRRYPTGPLFSDVVGYATQSRNRVGLEQSYNDFLTGSNANLDTLFRSTLDKLRGVTATGNDLILTIRPGLQALSRRLLQGKCGAVVVLEPASGRVLAMTTNPTYNPNLIERRFAQAARTSLPCGAPLLNRATAGKYQPGSTFKIVTVSAALQSRRFTPDSPFYDPGYCVEYGKRVRNAGNPEAPETFYSVNLSVGFQHSINSVFCNIGKALGAGAVLQEAKRYGFYSSPPVDLPENEVVPSGLYDHGRLFQPTNPATQVDPGRLAFGQERLQVTPLEMAMIAAAVANHGVEMRPHLVERIVSSGGRTVTKAKPERLAIPINPQTAAEITHMMELVVQGGTGTAAQIPGIRVAGKTGTAETGQGNLNTAWFTAFAPVEDPKIAIAVVLENQTGFGGTVAAPIAKRIIAAALR